MDIEEQPPSDEPARPGTTPGVFRLLSSDRPEIVPPGRQSRQQQREQRQQERQHEREQRPDQSRRSAGAILRRQLTSEIQKRRDNGQ